MLSFEALTASEVKQCEAQQASISVGAQRVNVNHSSFRDGPVTIELNHPRAKLARQVRLDNVPEDIVKKWGAPGYAANGLIFSCPGSGNRGVRLNAGDLIDANCPYYIVVSREVCRAVKQTWPKCERVGVVREAAGGRAGGKLTEPWTAYLIKTDKEMTSDQATLLESLGVVFGGREKTIEVLWPLV